MDASLAYAKNFGFDDIYIKHREDVQSLYAGDEWENEFIRYKSAELVGYNRATGAEISLCAISAIIFYFGSAEAAGTSILKAVIGSEPGTEQAAKALHKMWSAGLSVIGATNGILLDGVAVNPQFVGTDVAIRTICRFIEYHDPANTFAVVAFPSMGHHLRPLRVYPYDGVVALNMDDYDPSALHLTPTILKVG